MIDDLTRRDFLKTATATVAVSALAPTALAAGDETKIEAKVVNAEDAPHWCPFVYKVMHSLESLNDTTLPIYRRCWWPTSWEDLKVGDIVMWLNPDKEIDNKGTEREIQLITGEPAKFGGVWGVECRPFTVIRASDALDMTNDTWQATAAWKDGERVPLVQEVDLRTHTMKRISLDDWRLDHFRRCSEPGYSYGVAGKQTADYDLIEEPFDYLTLESQEWESGPPLTIVPPTRHMFGLPRESAISFEGKTVGILHDVESNDEGFTAGLMYLTRNHLNERCLRYSSLNYTARLVYDFQGTYVAMEGWDRSFLKEGVFVIEGARLRKTSA